jgi:hypothetical protein
VPCPAVNVINSQQLRVMNMATGTCTPIAISLDYFSALTGTLRGLFVVHLLAVLGGITA